MALSLHFQRRRNFCQGTKSAAFYWWLWGPGEIQAVWCFHAGFATQALHSHILLAPETSTMSLLALLVQDPLQHHATRSAAFGRGSRWGINRALVKKRATWQQNSLTLCKETPNDDHLPAALSSSLRGKCLAGGCLRKSVLIFTFRRRFLMVRARKPHLVFQHRRAGKYL